VSSLQQQLFSAQTKGLLDFYTVFFDRGDVGFFVARSAVKIAELAVGNANVGRIRIAVNDPGDDIARHMVLADGISDVHQFRGRGIFEKKNTFFRRKPFQAEGTLEEIRNIHI
jgi:hypothetical protein